MLAGEPPVGACLVRGREVVAQAHNAVIGELDITAHAEMRVIRDACRQLRTLVLSGMRLYVTVEPCAMCLAACHYADIAMIICGAGIADMNRVTGNELGCGARPQVPVTGGVLRDECVALLEEWAAARRRTG